MAKFKIGDKVIAKNGAPYGITTDGWIGTVVGTLENPNGHTIFSGDDIIVENNEEIGAFSVESKYFDFVSEPQKIVITTDGVKTTTAKLYEGKQVIKTAVAKCSPDDEFDFNIGAKIAFDRLFTNDLWKRFEAGKIEVKVTHDNYMKFLKLCEERDMKWNSGHAATAYNPFSFNEDCKFVFIHHKFNAYSFGLSRSYGSILPDTVEAAEFFVGQNEVESDEPKFTKADLKNGMFVIMNDGKIGVVVNNTIIYESGGYDIFDQMSDDMSFHYWHVTGVVTGVSFINAKETFEKNLEGVIYRRK